MTLSLNMGTTPSGLDVKTFSADGPVMLGSYEISVEDFLVAAHYVLTNTDLVPGDQRLQFLRCMQAMTEVSGWDETKLRLHSDEPPIVE